MRAIVSDIHSNIEALVAVKEDIERQGITEIICLGDVIGYGPNPREALAHARNFSENLPGNHEEAVLHGPKDFNPRAARAVEWTKAQLTEEDMRFLEGIYARMSFVRDGVIYVHGSPRDIGGSKTPTTEYILPTDVEIYTGKLDDIFTNHFGDAHTIFIGHTHVAGVIEQAVEPDDELGISGEYRFIQPKEVGGTIEIGDRKRIINIGSVGQPRDFDVRASYVTLDGNTVRWRRVPYDIEAVAAKIRAIPELDDYLADRLLVGK